MKLAGFAESCSPQASILVIEDRTGGVPQSDELIVRLEKFRPLPPKTGASASSWQRRKSSTLILRDFCLLRLDPHPLQLEPSRFKLSNSHREAAQAASNSHIYACQPKNSRTGFKRVGAAVTGAVKNPTRLVRVCVHGGQRCS